MKKIIGKPTGIILFIAFFFCFFSLSSDAGKLIKWVDRDGNVHFSDGFMSVPLEYRDQVTVRELEDRTPEEPSPEKKKPEKETKPLTGEEVYKENCSPCHSLKGKSPDPNATKLTGLLKRKKFDEHILPVSEENIRKITIKGGWDNMPAFPDLEENGIDDLMEYLLPYLEE